MQNGAATERAEAFKAVKPGATVYPVDENANSDVEAIIDEYDDFVFLNGNTCADALGMLKAKGKNVYAFDVYEEFLENDVEEFWVYWQFKYKKWLHLFWALRLLS